MTADRRVLRDGLVALVRSDAVPILDAAAAEFLAADALADDWRAITVACESGSVGALHWLVTTFGLKPEDLLDAVDPGNHSAVTVLCEDGCVEAATRLAEAFGLGPEHSGDHVLVALRMACDAGDQTIAQWLLDTYQLGLSDVRGSEDGDFIHCLSHLCRRNDLGMAQWAAEAFALESADGKADGNAPLLAAIQHDNLEMAQWLVEKFNLGVADIRAGNDAALCAAAGSGRLRMVKWLVRRFALGADDGVAGALATACNYGQPDVARWLALGFQAGAGGRWVRPSHPTCSPSVPVCDKFGGCGFSSDYTRDDDWMSPSPTTPTPLWAAERGTFLTSGRLQARPGESPKGVSLAGEIPEGCPEA